MCVWCIFYASRGQKRVFVITILCLIPGTGFLTEPGAELVASKPKVALLLLPLPQHCDQQLRWRPQLAFFMWVLRDLNSNLHV